ncbi:MAG: type II secretion system protein GspD [Fimbriimonas sp.]
MRVNKASLAMVALVAVCAFAPVSVVLAQTADVRFDVNLKDADMVAATRMLTQRTGLQFVIEPSDLPYGRITLKLDSVSPEDAIKYICQSAGAYFRRDEKGVYIIGRTKPVEVAPAEAAPAPKAPKIAKKLKVLKASGQDIYNAIVFGMTYDSRSTFADMKSFLDNQNAPAQGSYGSRANPYQAPSQSFYPMGSRQISSPLSPREAGNTILLPEESAAQLGGRGGGQGGGFGGGGQQGGFGGGGQQGGGGFGGGQGAGGNIQLTPGTGLIPTGIDFITYDPADNSLVVRGDEEAINQLQQYISLFDVAPRQLTIKVEFITTTGTLDRSLGFDWLYQRGTVLTGNRPGSFARSGDPVFLNYATGNVTTRLRTFLSEGNAKVVTAPIIRTLNNQLAFVQNVVTTTIFINNSTITNGGTVVNTPTPLQLTAQTFLVVTPRINEDNTVTVGLAPQIQNFVGVSTGPDGQQIPNTSQQQIGVVARVKNGETIVLGGMTNKSDDFSVNRIPVLSELPIVGQFFRGTRRSRTNSELLIFVTPQVLDDEDTGIG